MTRKKKIILVFLVLFLLLMFAGGAYAYYVINSLTDDTLQVENLAVNTELDDTVINIAFFGIDGRDDVEVEGDRTDVIMIGTLDTKSNAIKVTSIMRDTYSKIVIDPTSYSSTFYAGDQDGIEWEIDSDTKVIETPKTYSDEDAYDSTEEVETDVSETETYDDEERVTIDYDNRSNVATYDKINAAFFEGGVESSIATLNTNFDLNIQDYVTVDFNSLIDVVDILGGITVNIVDEEMLYWTNKYLQDSNFYGHRNDPDLEEIGEQTVTGAQALAFARNRYSDSDYGRSMRQREVVQAIFNKAKDMDILTAINLVTKVYPYIKTSLSLSELTNYASVVLNAQDITFEDYRIPNNAYGTSGFINGVWYLFPDTLVDNCIALHKFIYGDEAYTPSNTVQQISQVIEDTLTYKAYDKTYEVGGSALESMTADIEEAIDSETDEEVNSTDTTALDDTETYSETDYYY